MRNRTRRGVLSVFMAVALVAMMAAPASAAEKVFEFRETNFSMTIEEGFGAENLPDSVCGVEEFTGFLSFDVLHIVEWDNGRYMVSTTNSVTIFDLDGNLILRDRYVYQERGVGELPQKLVISVVSHCTRHSETPGKLFRGHLTMTWGLDGILKQQHGEEGLAEEPCVVYDFC